jgi:adenylate cyclase
MHRIIASPQVLASRRRERLEGRVPRVAVMPYFVVSDGVLKPLFGRKVTVRLIELLASVDDLLVINAASLLDTSPRTEPRVVGQSLGADFVLKGQICRADQELYFSQSLHDVRSGEVALTRTVTCSIGHLEDFERDVLSRVVATIRWPMREATITRLLRRRPRDATAYELGIQAQLAMHRMDKRSMDRARGYLVRASAIEPTHAAAFAWLARNHSIRVGQGWTQNRAEERRIASDLAERAVRLDGESAIALATAGHLRSYLHRDFEGAEELLSRAIVACPNEPLGWLMLGATLGYTGRGEEGLRLVRYGMSLSPADRFMFNFLCFGAICSYAAGDLEGARDLAASARALNPRYSTALKAQIVSLVGLGDVKEARAVAADLLQLEPGYPEVAAATVPFADPADRELFLLRMRTAGVFERRRQPRPVALAKSAARARR